MKGDKKMKRYGENFKLNQKLMNAIASYMNDEIREELHNEIAPCEPEEFLKKYMERDPDFEELLEREFGIEL